MLIREPLKRYLEKLSSDSPAPGGGSASAAVGAIGASLVLMVVRIVRKKALKRTQKSIDRTIQLLLRILKTMEEIIDLDVQVYEALMAACHEAKKGNQNNSLARKKVETALNNSFRLQADLALLVLMVKEAMVSVRRISKGSIANDLVVARGFLDGAFQGAVATARINLVYIKSAWKRHFERAIRQLEKKYQSIRSA